MGLFKLLTFPVTGPVIGTHWVLRTLVSEAERRYYDEDAILQEIAALETAHRGGELTDEEFDQREEALFERLLEARDYHRRRAAGE
ncbi:MAG TPA: gas vesicle protein GvpG [Tepidisphaeraceae bacterium]|nr:gas vesicle protein GvpG [Tepidisphaeraceae bacterium]